MGLGRGMLPYPVSKLEKKKKENNLTGKRNGELEPSWST